MTILITGATGTIGKRIMNICRDKGYNVNYLTRSANHLDDKNYGNGFLWDIESMKIDESCFKDVDAIINLAGAPINKRWTKDYKEEILNSRIKSLELLKKGLQNYNHKVKQITSASAIGIYPSSFTKYYAEDNKVISSTFLGDVLKEWETEVNSFDQLGIKTCIVRIGLVLSSKGGALPEMIKPTKLGLGAAFGSGKQWQSWIHVDDLAKLFLYTVEAELVGVYNGVAPNPVTNQGFIETVAKTLKRPLILPNIPKLVMKLLLGEIHILVFESQRVSSERIERKGFDFKHPNLGPAITNLLD